MRIRVYDSGFFSLTEILQKCKWIAQNYQIIVDLNIKQGRSISEKSKRGVGEGPAITEKIKIISL